MQTAQSFKQVKFGRGATILNAAPGEFLPLERIAREAPAVFAETKHESRSERYQFIDSRKMIEGLLAAGFGISEVRQGGSRIPGKREFTKHLLRLRFRGEEGQGIKIARDTIIPEVVMTNAHDGTSSTQLGAGCFKIICANGLIGGDLFEYLRVTHRAGAEDEVINAAFRVIDQFPALAGNADNMARVDLRPAEIVAFGRAARELRWDQEDDSAPEISATRLTEARRIEDRPNDLWTVFNRTQENVIRGGIGYTRVTEREDGSKRTSHRKTGEIRGIEDNNRLNRALWTLAAEMEKIKAAA